MPKSKILKPVQDLFYVWQSGDDFTFYLNRSNRNDNGDEPATSKLQKRLTFPTDKEFSFSERISVLCLTLTSDSLAGDERLLWKELKRNEKSYVRVAEFRALLRRTSAPADLRDALLKALNAAINKPSLANEKWVAGLTAAEETFLNSVTAPPLMRKKWRHRLLVEKSFPGLIKKIAVKETAGRALFCLTNYGKSISVTFRKLTTKSGFVAGGFLTKDTRSPNLFSIEEYCDRIYSEVFIRTESVDHAHGLLVITGSTHSAKSEIARGLIDIHLRQSLKQNPDRKPHLITFEDPIERRYGTWLDSSDRTLWNVANSKTVKEQIDYTAREKENDANSLEIALEDALRQTPAVFFVGETRQQSEWNLLLNFAATGHLIVTTAHAGSLVEAMHKIFEARAVKTSGGRSEIAKKLLGIVHLTREKLELE
jgi:hypothetical protein